VRLCGVDYHIIFSTIVGHGKKIIDILSTIIVYYQLTKFSSLTTFNLGKWIAERRADHSCEVFNEWELCLAIKSLVVENISPQNS
jgi:hypothetical protein